MESDSQIIKFEEWSDFGMLHLIMKHLYSAAFIFFSFCLFLCACISMLLA